MKKLIRLKPITPFFFGTNKTFADETLHDVVSSYFPQQTHLLGMLKFFLMQSHGYLKLRERGRWVKRKDYYDAVSLVGDKDSWGIISSLSPVFLASINSNKVVDLHFVAPKDIGLKIEPQNENYLYIAGKKREKTFKIENYNPKVGCVEALTTKEFWNNYNSIPIRNYDEKITKEYLENLNLLSFGKVFKEVKQVGIRRDLKTRTVKSNDEGSFYYKTSYDLNESFEFAFIADLTQEIATKEGIVYLGAERSVFEIYVEDYTSEIDNLLPNYKDSSNKQIAMSDIYLENFDSVDFMINQDYIAHAYQKPTPKEDGKNYFRHNPSKQQHFIPKGSVIYFKDNFDVNSLDSKLGYNKFITKKGA